MRNVRYTFFDAEAMLSQALDLKALGPNIAIKIPGTLEGVGVLSRLTALGISTNCTAAYTGVPQLNAPDGIRMGWSEHELGCQMGLRRRGG